MPARTSIKSAGVARLIGKLVQGRSDLAMQEESLVKLEGETFVRGLICWRCLPNCLRDLGSYDGPEMAMRGKIGGYITELI